MSAARRDPDAWWRNGVIYQIYPRSFGDSNGDGTGDFRGIIDRLDHLNDGSRDSLGVDGIWLSPMFPSPGYDVGYDVADYDAVDPLFGSMDDFMALVEECRKRGIHVLLDLVMNHSSHEHPWFKESRSSRDNPKRDWYIWRSPKPGRRYPNNWRSFFGGSAWQWDRKTRQHYLHTFLREQPDLNWHQPQVQAEMLKMIRGWLDRGVDGFRLDVFNVFFKHVDLPDQPVLRGQKGWNRLDHIYDRSQPEMDGFLRAFRALLDARPGRVSVGELFYGSIEEAVRYSGSGPDQLHLSFYFPFLLQPWRADGFQRVIAEWDTALGEDWPCYVLGNHDQSRLATRYGAGLPDDEVDAICKVAATLLLTQRGTPFLFQGEEIGMRDTDVPLDARKDTPAIRFDFEGRDPERTPIPWSGEAPGYGFTTAAETWLPFGADVATRNVAAQRGQKGSVLDWHRRLLWLRRESPALHAGSWTPLIDAPDAALAYLREAGGQRMLVALNFIREPADITLDAARLPAGRWRTRLSTHDDSGDSRLVAGELQLEPHEALILEAVEGA